jgi:hypothetical protein
MTSATSDVFTLAYSTDENETTANPNSNDSAAKAVALIPGVPVFGTMLAFDDLDYYKFHAKAGQILSVSSYANRLDLANWDRSLRLRLIAPDGTTELQRMSSDDWGPPSVDNGFAGIRVPADGDYYLACDVDASGSLGTAESAKYALLVKLADGPAALQIEAEASGQSGHNDSILTAQPISPGVVSGQYQSPGTGPSQSDSDFYELAITGPTRIHLDLLAARNGVANGGASWDAMLQLQDAHGVVLWSNDDTFFTDPSIDYVVVNPGKYYVRVVRLAETDVGSAPYFLSYDAVPYSPAAAPNTTAASPMPIGFDQYVTGTFAAAGGQQFFAINGNDGDLVRIWIQDKSNLQGSQLQMDPSLPADAMFVKADGTALPAAAQPFTSNPPGSSELNVRQTILQQTGLQLVRVSSTTGGQFGIRIERVAAAGSTPGWFAGKLPAGLAPADTKNVHTVHAEEGQLVTISVLAAMRGSQNHASPFSDWGSALLPKVQVLDGQGKVLATTNADRLGATNYAESMLRPDAMLETSFRAPAAGDYDVVVSDANNQGGPAFFYALQVWKNQ